MSNPIPNQQRNHTHLHYLHPDLSVETYTSAPLRIAQTCYLGAEAQALFWYITDNNHICDFVPGVQKVSEATSTQGSQIGVGSVRYCDFGRDMVIKETIVLWQPPLLFGYCVDAPNPFGIFNHFALVHCETTVCQTAQMGSRLSWSQYYDHADLTAINQAMQTMMAGMMTNLIKIFKVLPVNSALARNKQPK